MIFKPLVARYSNRSEFNACKLFSHICIRIPPMTTWNSRELLRAAPPTSSTEFRLPFSWGNPPGSRSSGPCSVFVHQPPRFCGHCLRLSDAWSSFACAQRPQRVSTLPVCYRCSGAARALHSNPIEFKIQSPLSTFTFSTSRKLVNSLLKPVDETDDGLRTVVKGCSTNSVSR